MKKVSIAERIWYTSSIPRLRVKVVVVSEYWYGGEENVSCHISVPSILSYRAIVKAHVIRALCTFKRYPYCAPIIAEARHKIRSAATASNRWMSTPLAQPNPDVESIDSGDIWALSLATRILKHWTQFCKTRIDKNSPFQHQRLNCSRDCCNH